MPTKKVLIRSHWKKLIELTYLAFLGRPAEESAIGPAVDAISEKGYNFYLSGIKCSKEFCLLNISPSAIFTHFNSSIEGNQNISNLSVCCLKIEDLIKIAKELC